MATFFKTWQIYPAIILIFLIMWQMSSCATGHLKIVDMGTKEWIEIALTAVFGAVGIISYLNNRAIANEKSKNENFRNNISTKMDNFEVIQKKRDDLIIEQLGQMSTALSDKLKDAIKSVQDVREDMKESMAMYEENREMNVKQQVEIDSIKVDIIELNTRVSELEKRRR